MDVSACEELIAGQPVGVVVLVPVVAVDLLVVVDVVSASILAAGPKRVAPVVSSALVVSAFSVEGLSLSSTCSRPPSPRLPPVSVLPALLSFFRVSYKLTWADVVVTGCAS